MGDYELKKPNRQARQVPKAHRQVIHKPLGLPPWERKKDIKEKNRKRAEIVKKARRKG